MSCGNKLTIKNCLDNDNIYPRHLNVWSVASVWNTNGTGGDQQAPIKTNNVINHVAIYDTHEYNSLKPTSASMSTKRLIV